jgi:integrase
MSLIKRGKVWHIDIRRDGHAPVRISCKTTDKKLAQIQHADVEKALLLGQDVVRGVGGPTLKAAFDMALALHWKGLPSYGTVLDHRTHIFGSIPPPTALGAIRIEHVQALIAALEARNNAPTTINKKLHTLHTAMVKAVEFKLWNVPVSSVLKMPSFREPRGRIRVFTRGEEAMILAHFSRTYPRMTDFVAAMVDTGMRLGEILRRETLEHDRVARTVHLWDTKGGTHYERRIPLTVRADESLARWLALPNVRKNQIEWYWRSMRDALGHRDDDEFVIHALRHTCCTRLVLAGMDLRRVQMWMGHRDINTTLRYANVRMDELAPLAAALEPPAITPLEAHV